MGSTAGGPSPSDLGALGDPADVCGNDRPTPASAHATTWHRGMNRLALDAARGVRGCTRGLGCRLQRWRGQAPRTRPTVELQGLLLVRFSVDLDAPGPSYGQFGRPTGHGRAENFKADSESLGSDS